MSMKKGLCLLVASLSLCFPTIGNAEGRDFQFLEGAWQIVFDRNNEGGAKLAYTAYKAKLDARKPKAN